MTTVGSMSVLAVCASCGFENPRSWRACAKCGHALGSHLATAEVTRVDASSPGPGALDADLSERTDPDGPTLRTAAVVANDAEMPLIGQRAGAEAIRSGTERAFTLGTPTLVALEGKRGAGKTRLLVYASEYAAGIAPDVRVLYGSCREDGGDGSYAPFSRILLERFGVTPASSPDAVRAEMVRVVSDALQSADPTDTEETTHLLGHLAGVPFPDSPFLARLKERPDELHERTVRAVRRWLEGEASRRPVVLLLDNFHHGEDEAWQVLEDLVQADAHVAIIVGGEAPLGRRAERLVPTGGVAVRSLAALEEAEVASMLHVLLPSLESAPEALVAAVTHRASGNPGEVRELVLALEDAGVFVMEGGSLEVDLGRLSTGELPVSTDDAIRARIARLDPFEKATLERAAVVGQRFWDGAVLAELRSDREPPGDESDPLSIWGDDDDVEDVAEALARLEAKGFIKTAESSDVLGATEYNFVAATARAIVYGDLDEPTRNRRHGAVARWLAVMAEIRRYGVAAMIAPHLEKAGERGRAGRAYLEAAVHERANLQTSAALRSIERALELIPRQDVVRRIDALHEHGSLLTTVGRYEDALRAFTEMLRHAWSIGARGKGGAALNRLGRVFRARGDDAEARRYLDRALILFREAGDLRGVASTLDDLAHIHIRHGELDEGWKAASEALEIRRAHGDARGEALSLHNLGNIELARGLLDAAEHTFRQASGIRLSLQDHEGTLQSENSLGIVAFERGDREGAVSAWEKALEQARVMGDRRSEGLLLNNLGEALTSQGRYDEATAKLARAQEIAVELGDRRMTAEVERNAGLLALRRGDDGAEERLLRARELAEESDATELIALAHRAVGILHAQTVFDGTGEADRRAEESFLASIDLFREVGSEKEAARSLAELGRHLVERGENESARERLREARAIMRRMGLADLAKVDETLSLLG